MERVILQIVLIGLVGGVIGFALFEARKWKAKRDKRRMAQLGEMDRLERAGQLDMNKLASLRDASLTQTERSSSARRGAIAPSRSNSRASQSFTQDFLPFVATSCPSRSRAARWAPPPPG
jgi:hypothetical protein